MQHIIFESSPWLLLVCALVATGYATLLYYHTKHPWSNTLNGVLFAGRALVTFILTFLLLGPIIKQVNNLFEKPLYILLQDNSVSIKEATDSLARQAIERKLFALQKELEEKGYDCKLTNLAGVEVSSFTYETPVSDIHGALRKISDRFEGRNIAGVIVMTDGIYNSGLSPVFSSYPFPIHTIGVGDTTQRTDLMLKNIACNKIAYQGNTFPIQAEVLVTNLNNQPVTVSLFQRNTLIEKQTKNSGNSQLLVFHFTAQATEQGIQKLDVEIAANPGEHNTRNNRSSAFVEVVAGKKKILLVAPAPHPDIKALREVIHKNSNYEFLLHIPGLEEQPVSNLRPTEIDLAIFHQSPDLKGKTRSLSQQFAASKTPLFLVLGQQSDLREIIKLKMPLTMDALPRDYDDVTPLLNAAFTNFILSPETNSIISAYPPASVPFGKIQVPLHATPLLFQQVGSISTEKPLLAVEVTDSRKTAIMMGEGLWRWRLNEFERTEHTAVFDELFGKLIQYLCTSDDKRKFRSYPLQQEFSNTETVIFESQVFNDIYEPIYGNTVQLELVDDHGRKQSYSYVTSAGNIRYQVGGLAEGVYRYKAKTIINQKTEEVRGEFVVRDQLAELQNLTADFDLLRKLSNNTGGQFIHSSEIEKLQTSLSQKEVQSIIHSEETYSSIINLKGVFFLLVILISAEWFLRKYWGSY